MKSKPQAGAEDSSSLERFLTPKKRKKRRRVIVGSRSRRARQRMNRKAKQSSSTESSSEEEEEEESTAMEMSPSEEDIRIVDVISMEEPIETIGTRIVMHMSVFSLEFFFRHSGRASFRRS